MTTEQPTEPVPAPAQSATGQSTAEEDAAGQGAAGQGAAEQDAAGQGAAEEGAVGQGAVGHGGGGPVGAAFLLAQLGAHAAGVFAERIKVLDLTPPQAGLLRMLKANPGGSQRELADRLGMPPSRFVPFVDKMEQRGLVERRRNPDDRRLHALYLTEAGESLLGELIPIAIEHETDLTSALSPGEHQQLTELLRRIADERGLTPGVHPDFRSVRAR
ncbi:MarR family winged helix-turn-helix transcriptional regulator [Actinomadura rupiterrae]|uniref:MarR family winged helix-turn-helix transcriptional regulator n=1 Tax=Actinomadura rupiterrae TaxID=559627 RepID=UPI0020A35D13|nr:MarR family winged helix-turn-helix transcriptional regulator [Actinomadura rupiterrae]MCP2340331.1 DNA-binding MarR family transcriptional regulator [Actinomadura rupiterrae]